MKRALDGTHSWRAQLAAICGDPERKTDLLKRSGIPARTLARWISGETQTPLPIQLQRLLEALPDYRQDLLPLIQQEFPNFDVPPPLLLIDEALAELPVAFYTRYLEAHATVAPPLRFQMLTSIFFQQLLPHIDPRRVGVQAIIAICVPPGAGSGVVRSLHERVSYRRQIGLQEHGYFLGAESLSGYVAASGVAQVAQDVCQEIYRFPIRTGDDEQEASCAVYPIQRAGRVAGSLIVSSPTPYFFTRTVLQLIQYYVHLLQLAFAEEAFYPRPRLRLSFMPEASVQRPVLDTFARRLLAAQAAGACQDEAEILAMQQIEEHLLAHAPAQPGQRPLELEQEKTGKPAVVQEAQEQEPKTGTAGTGGGT